VANEERATLQYEHSIMAGLGTLVGASSYVLDMHDLAYSRYDHVDSPVAPVMRRGVAWLEQRAVRKADRIIAVSEYMADQLQSEWGVPASKLSVVPNGYFPESIDPFRAVSTVTGRVAFLGTLHPKVDVETLVAVAELPAVEEMVVIGDGAQRRRIKQAASRSDALRTTGRLPDDEAFELVASAEAVVNPQTVSAIQRSSSPVKLYYYAALGKPMVVTPGPSVVETLVRRDAAITARSRYHFVDRVRELLNSPMLRTRLGENARQAAKEYLWSNRVNTVEQILSSRWASDGRDES
jgi:glycosyltransferase involved in cell wall biosynthesis